ncbi:MAG: RagB/SusD family nutrient uptake outer membrane protein [Rikenellaceae bacterium]
MKLKNITLLTIGAIAAAASFTSCDDFADDYLTQTNPNELNTGVFWQDLDDCQSGLTAVYNAFKSQNLMGTLIETKRSDLCWVGTATFPTATDAFYLQTFNSTDSSIANKWSALYKGIFRANQVIEGLDQVADLEGSKLDVDEWTSIKAQAHFFRGLFYFYLSTSYNEGAVPIFDFVPTTTSEFYLPCNTAQNVIDFYRADLEYAEENLPVKGSSSDWGSGDLGRPNSETASATLGTSYLYEADYTTAEAYFKKIINNSTYQLSESNDNASETQELDTETLLEIIYTYEYKTEYTYGNDEALTTQLNMSLSNVGGWTTVYTSYWLMHAMTHEPVDHLNPDNRIDMEKDEHGDVYYAHDPSIYQPTVQLGGVSHKIYPVIATLNDVKGYMNGTYEEDEICWLDNTTYTYNTVPSEVTGCSTQAWPDSLYVFLKKVRVDSNGAVIAQSRDEFQTDVNEGYELLGGNQDMIPTRPFAGDRSKGAVKVYDATKTSAASTSRDDQLFEYQRASADAEPYRYKQRSNRSYYSVSTYFDMDKGDYTYPFPADHCKSNNYGMFRKYTNWMTRLLETNAVNSDSAINMRVIRLSDVYLMYAECLIKGGTDDSRLGDALKYVNKVRKRAGTVLVGEEKYGEYVGSATYQDSHYPEYNVFKGDYYDLYDTNNIAAANTVGSPTTSADIIDTAAELMDHLMYFERPLELNLDGHAIRTNDLRRWGITKARFQDLATNWAFSTTGCHFFNSAEIYDDKNLKIDLATNCKNWKWRFKYLPFDDDFNKYFWLKNGTLSHTGAYYEFTQPAANYTDSKAYYPIPNDEVTTNPYVTQIVDRDAEE